MSVFLAIAMTVTSFLSGCGASKVNQNSSQSTTKVEEKKAPVTLVWYFAPQGDYRASDPATLKKVHDYIQDKTNVDLQFITASQDPNEKKNKLNLLLAAKEKVDIFNSDIESYQPKGIIADISGDLQKYGQDVLKAWGPEPFETVKTSDGKIWGIPRMVDYTTYPVFVRQDWLDKLNLAVPKTIDDLENVLKVFKEKDPAGGGKTMTMITNFTGTQPALKYSLMGAFLDNGYGQFKDTDNKIKPYYLDAGYKDFLTKMSKWYSLGYIEKETFSYNTNQFVDFIKAGRVGVSDVWYSRVTINEFQARITTPGLKYVMAAPLTGPKGKAETINTAIKLPSPSGGAGTLAYMTPSYNKNIAEFVKLYNWGYSDVENYIVAGFGMKDVDWKYNNEKIHEYEIIGGPENRKYFGELNCLPGFPLEKNSRLKSPASDIHSDYLRDSAQSFERAKWPFDKFVKYDGPALNAACPTYADIERIVDEESVKFIMGANPLADYDKFLAKLKAAGVDKLVDEITKQYNSQKK